MSNLSTEFAGNFPQYTAYNSYLANELRKLDQDVSIESALINTMDEVELAARQIEIERVTSYVPTIVATVNAFMEHPDDPQVYDGCAKMLSSFGIVDTEGLVKDVWNWLKELFIKIKNWITDLFRAFLGKTIKITPARERAHKAAVANIMDDTKVVKLLDMKIDNAYAFHDIDKLRTIVQSAIGLLNSRYAIVDIADMFIDSSDPNPQKRTSGGMPKIEYFIPEKVNESKRLQELGWVPSNIGVVISDTVPFFRSEFFRELESTQNHINKELGDITRKIDSLRMNSIQNDVEKLKLEETARDAKIASKSLSKILEMSNVFFQWSERLINIVNSL
jgi:hypothetical protein